jgi:hypothetical protein
MDTQTRQFITEELTALLQRAPTEQEIQNGQTDTYITGKVNARIASAQTATISTQVNKLSTNKVIQ